jgi:hypothetical protein
MFVHSLASRKKRRLMRGAEEADVSAAGLPPTQAQLLTLQRQAGNKAVAAFLAGHGPAPMQADRTSPTNMRATRSAKEEFRAVFMSDTYSKIIAALADFRRKPDLLQAVSIVGLCDQWLKKHGAEVTPRSRAKKSLVEDVRAEVWRDAGKLRAQAAYLQQFEGGEGTRHALAAPSRDTKTAALAPASELAAGKVTAKAGNIGNPEELARLKGGAELITKYKLSAAEVASIRAYTSGDYRYINPTAAQDEEWLKKNMARNQGVGGSYFNPKATKEQLKEEGPVHTGMMVEGLARLPAWEGVLYRGERQEFDKVLELYATGTYEQKNIGSATMSRSVARTYANGMGGGDPEPDQNVFVMVVLHVTNGRDISKISAVAKEGEVTILPGAKFDIINVTAMKTGPPGNARVPAKAWYVVHMNQKS